MGNDGVHSVLAVHRREKLDRLGASWDGPFAEMGHQRKSASGSRWVLLYASILLVRKKARGRGVGGEGWYVG